MNVGLLHHRVKGTRTFVFCFEGGAMRFAEFLTRWNVKFAWVIDLENGENRITID